jgi:hypothetical protein
MNKGILLLTVVLIAGFAFASAPAAPPVPVNPYIQAKMLNFACIITKVVFPMNTSINAMNSTQGAISKICIRQMAALSPSMTSAALSNQTGAFNGYYAQMMVLVNLERSLYIQTAQVSHADFGTILSDYASYQADYANCMVHGPGPG